MAFKLRIREILITAFVATLIGLPCLFMYHKPSAEHIQAALSNFNYLLHPETLDVEQLESLLARASMPNRTVIITTLNHAWAANNTMIDLFYESFHRGKDTKSLLKHLLIVALDKKAYDRCIDLHPYCFMLRTYGVDFTAEKFFMSKDYLKMMWRRMKFLGSVLEMDYNFVFSDADILWFRDPFPRFNKDADFQIACDRYFGGPTAIERNAPNGGFLYVRSNNRTIAMYKYWYEAREQNPGKHDQDVLSVIFREKDFLDIGVKIWFLETVEFSGFCQKSNDMSRVVTMHANCCTGLNNKLADLHMTLEDWNASRGKQNPNLWRAPIAYAIGLAKEWTRIERAHMAVARQPLDPLFYGPGGGLGLQ